MGNLSRRSVLRTSLAAAAAGTIARPYIANAAATTATVWWVQGFAEEEDIAFKQMVADYEKASGNTDRATASCRLPRCGRRRSPRSRAASCPTSSMSATISLLC